MRSASSRRALGIDPGTTGYYFCVVEERDDRRFDVHQIGEQTDLAFDAVRRQVTAARADVCVEDIAAWIDDKKKFKPLIQSSEVVGILRAACSSLGLPMMRVDQRTWRTRAGIRGAGQDRQVAAYCDLNIVVRPDRPWNNHVRDACAIAIDTVAQSRLTAQWQRIAQQNVL